MKYSLKWNKNLGMNLFSKTKSGHIVIMDSSKKLGGKNSAPRPMELLLLGTAGCTTYDVISILKKNKQKIQICKTNIKYKRAKKNPKVFTKIKFKFIFKGKKIKSNILKNAINLSYKKYCSAVSMISKTAKIIYKFKIINKKTH